MSKKSSLITLILSIILYGIFVSQAVATSTNLTIDNRTDYIISIPKIRLKNFQTDQWARMENEPELAEIRQHVPVTVPLPTDDVLMGVMEVIVSSSETGHPTLGQANIDTGLDVRATEPISKKDKINLPGGKQVQISIVPKSTKITTKELKNEYIYDIVITFEEK